jgi:hypothetical protein
MTDSKPSEIGPGIDRWLYLVQVGCPLVRPFHDIWDQDFGTGQLADVVPDRTQGSAKDLASDVG